MKRDRHLENEIETLIRSGRISEARLRIAGLADLALTREGIQLLANFQYRTGLFLDAVKLLGPIVYPRTGLASSATDAEIGTYAVSLLRLGSASEAQGLLDRIVKRYPKARLYQAFAHQVEWNYAAAILSLQSFLQDQVNEDSYTLAIARVNLAAGTIAEDNLELAAGLLDDLDRETTEQGWSLLRQNIYELKGQLAIKISQFDEAEQMLRSASKNSNRSDTLWDFFVFKWLAILAWRKHSDEVGIQRLKLVRQRAFEINHPESVRELDAILAHGQRDLNLLQHNYFGTPHASYRERLAREAQSWTKIPETYLLGGNTRNVLDLTNGTLSHGENLIPGSVLHRCLCGLADDLYRPPFYSMLYAKMFPDEYFNPVQAPHRVANVISRLRSWIEENSLPMMIETEGSFYRLVRTEPRELGFLYNLSHRESIDRSSPQLRLEQLRKSELCEFSSQEAAQVLQISKATAVRLLNEGVETGKLEKKGGSRHVKYRFAA